jgi:hypothetical protein
LSNARPLVKMFDFRKLIIFIKKTLSKNWIRPIYEKYFWKRMMFWGLKLRIILLGEWNFPCFLLLAYFSIREKCQNSFKKKLCSQIIKFLSLNIIFSEKNPDTFLYLKKYVKSQTWENFVFLNKMILSLILKTLHIFKNIFHMFLLFNS